MAREQGFFRSRHGFSRGLQHQTAAGDLRGGLIFGRQGFEAGGLAFGQFDPLGRIGLSSGLDGESLALGLGNDFVLIAGGLVDGTDAVFLGRGHVTESLADFFGHMDILQLHVLH